MSVLLTLLFSSILTSISWAVPDNHCGNGVIQFTSQPRDVKIFEDIHSAAMFPCNYEEGRLRQVHPQWIINSTVYNLQLPPDHQYLHSTHTLSVTNIKHWQNGTTYQCRVQVVVKGQRCVFWSSIGRLIIKGFEVQTSTHYYTDSQKQEIMTEIFLSFSQVDSIASYDLIFTDLTSGKDCDSDAIPASSCVDGTCGYVFKVPLSSCPINTDINIIVRVSGSGFSKQINIDAVNNFIKIIFSEATSSITLKFINQPKESEKYYTVRYGALEPNCRHLPIHTKGRLINSNYITIEFNIHQENTAVTVTDICWSVIVTNGTKTVSVEGIYSSGMHNKHTLVVISASIIVLVTIFVSLMFIVMLYYHFTGQLSNNNLKGVIYVNKSEEDPVIILEPIDLSTTFYKLLNVIQECSIYEFGKEHFPDYQSDHGFGYCKASGAFKPTQLVHKRVIVMDNFIPRYTIISSAIKQQSNITANSNIYVQERGCRTLYPGDMFLYCARSKDITKKAYWKVFYVTHECKESNFIEEKFLGYNLDWIRYGYFEMTKPTYLEATQSLIVLKKDGKLVKGPGVRHYLAQDSSTIVHPPNLEVDHPQWQHVFVQSTDGERPLAQGTKYLFCAMMKTISYGIHREVDVVNKECTLEEFGRQYSPVFKAELGYGYFEFTELECLEPHKNVIVMDKEGRLFTGAGAKFFYINCRYGKEELELRRKVSPPDLRGTEWKHVFIQSHSKNRMLRKGTLFLYCEYSTIEQL